MDRLMYFTSKSYQNMPIGPGLSTKPKKHLSRVKGKRGEKRDSRDLK